MYIECSECQALLECERPPFVCPNCGLAGVTFSSVGADELRQRWVEDGELPIAVELDGAEPGFRMERQGILRFARAPGRPTT